jgi:hypothetical protein
VTIRLLNNQERPAAEACRVSRSDEIAHAIFDEAVAAARVRTRADHHLCGFDELVNVPGFFGHFMQDLAAGVAQALAANDHRVLAVYGYEAAVDPVSEAQAPCGALVHLVVLVTAPSAALEAFVASLNRALGARFNPAGPVLDINAVTEREVRQRVGFGRLLSPVLPTVKLWQRKE